MTVGIYIYRPSSSTHCFLLFRNGRATGGMTFIGSAHLDEKRRFISILFYFFFEVLVVCSFQGIKI